MRCEQMSHLKKKKAPTGQRKKKSGNSAGIAVIVIILAVLIATGGRLLYVSPGRGSCREVITSSRAHVCNLEPVQILNCMYPTMTTKGIQLAIGTAQLATGEDMSDVLTEIVNAMGVLPEGMTLSDFIKTIKLTPNRMGLPGKVRKVR